MQVDYDPDTKLITLSGQRWSETFPPEQLRAKLMFYRSLRDREDGRYAGYYRPTVSGLETLQQRLNRDDGSA